MNSYTKLFASILDSSIWAENDQTRIVWITMLAMADQHGEVQASIPGLARRAGVSIEATAAAIELLSSPDPYSRTPDHEGRRIAKIDGGWEILNHGKYRRMASLDDRKQKAAERQRRHRERVRGARDGRPESVTERDMSRESVTERDMSRESVTGNAQQGVSHAAVTHSPDKAEAEAEAEAETPYLSIVRNPAPPRQAGKGRASEGEGNQGTAGNPPGASRGPSGVPVPSPAPQNVPARQGGSGNEPSREDPNSGNLPKRTQRMAAARPVLALLNELTGRKYRETEANLLLIAARLDEPGVDLDGVTKMLRRQAALWGPDARMSEYLRPETLFNRTKFESYYANRDQPLPAPSSGQGVRGHHRNAAISGAADVARSVAEKARRDEDLADSGVLPFGGP